MWQNCLPAPPFLLSQESTGAQAQVVLQDARFLILDEYRLSSIEDGL